MADLIFFWPFRHATCDHPKEGFFYSVKHNYLDLADEAAKLTLNKRASEFLVQLRDAGLPDDVGYRWVGHIPDVQTHD